MYSLIFIALLVALIFMSGVAFYFYKLAGSVAINHDLQPFSQFLLGVCAAAFAVIVVFLFYIFVDEGFDIRNNMGQVGDFIGGLTNPTLSFIALLVLLRSTLIQTNEARKTAELLLRQQQILESERFEAGFYAIFERFDSLAEKTVRIKASSDAGSISKVNAQLRMNREEIDLLPIRERYESVKVEVIASLRSDAHKRFCVWGLRVFNYIDGSNQSETKKKYYVRILFESMSPPECIFFLTNTFVSWPRARKKLRKYRPAVSIKRDRFISGFVFDYFTKKY